MNRVSLLFGFLLLSLTGQAQSTNDLQALKQKYQTCLDQGANMLGCTQIYYRQMDSLLNVAYNRLRAPLNPSQKAVLKQEQLKWLRERDNFFKKTDHEIANDPELGPGGKDSQMIALDQKAAFVEKRVEALLKKIKP